MIITSANPAKPLLLAALLLCILPVGCSQSRPPAVRTPPAPAPLLTLRQQLAIINARAAALTTLRATGSIRLDYRGRTGHRHQYQANSTLLVNQAPALSDPLHKTKPEMLLIGTYLGQDAFELGMNTTDYWMVNHQSKQAWVGRFGPAGPRPVPPGAIPFRPDRVLRMLAIGGVYQRPGRRVAMTAARRSALNRIYMIRQGKNGHTWIHRILFFNRRLGEVVAVIIFDRAGLSVATASLQDYRPVAARGKRPAAKSPQVPFRVEIWYPAGHAHLILKLAHASLTLHVAPRFAFALPRFSGLKVVRVDGSAGENSTR